MQVSITLAWCAVEKCKCNQVNGSRSRRPPAENTLTRQYRNSRQLLPITSNGLKASLCIPRSEKTSCQRWVASRRYVTKGRPVHSSRRFSPSSLQTPNVSSPSSGRRSSDEVRVTGRNSSSPVNEYNGSVCCIARNNGRLDDSEQ